MVAGNDAQTTATGAAPRNKGGRPVKVGKKKMQTQQRRAKIAMLIQAKPGITQREIADLIAAGPNGGKPLSVKTIERDIQQLREQWRSSALEATEQVMLEDLSRLDAMLEALWPQAVGADKYAVDRVLAIIDRKKEILGYSRPEQVKVTVDSPPITIVEVVRALGPAVVVHETHQIGMSGTTADQAVQNGTVTTSKPVTIDGEVTSRG